MSKLIHHFLTNPSITLPFTKRGLLISNKVINHIQPDLYSKLEQSCISYMEGLIDLDEEYLKSTTSPFLFSKIEAEIKKLREGGFDSSLSQKFTKDMEKYGLYLNAENQMQNTPRVQVYPYVAFGCHINNRIANHPYDEVLQLTRNRFFAKYNHSDPLTYLRSLANYTCGFRYEFLPIVADSDLSPIAITLEGNLDSQEFYVIDLNNQIVMGEEERE